jgi:flagellar hook-associated protein 2
MTSTISLASLGLGSGINDASIISQLVAVQQAPLTAMQTQQSNIQSASQTISSFSANLSSLQSAANALSDPTQYSSYTATSSSSALVASASSTASPGTYSVQVNSLAQAQLTYGDPQSSSTSALGMSGSLGITIGNNTYNVTVGTGDSLATIASNINSSGAGVSAAVVFDGTTYRLQVQGNATGAANAFTFNESGFSLGLSTPSNTYQPAQDASATVNNIPVTSPTNQLSGAIPGVTLALTATTTSPVSVTVASNPSAISQNISAFVTAYNTMVSAGHAATGYGTTAASNTLLTGDRGVQSALGQLSNLIASNVPGADSTFQNLASIGLTLNNDGSLSLNSTTLSSAIASDPSGVEKLFVTNPSTGSTGIMGTISKTIDSLANNAGSPLKTEIQSFATRVTSLTSQESATQARIATYQKQIQAEFTAMETTVQAEKTDFTNLGGTGTFV